ncbi:MAG: DUF2306 domain-containing protein [Nostocoides sp.]
MTTPSQRMSNRTRRAALVSVTALCLTIGGYGVALAASGFAFLPDTVAANSMSTAVKAHIVTASIALLVLPWQLDPHWQGGHRHRMLGRVYAVVAFLGGLAGVVAAPGSTGGGVAVAGFFLLGLAWMVTTATAIVNAVAGHVVAHRRWALRSFALAFAGVTLRLELPLLTLVVPYAMAYAIVAWLCWVPNLLVVQRLVHAGERQPAMAGLAHGARQRTGGGTGQRARAGAAVGAHPGPGDAAGRPGHRDAAGGPTGVRARL